VCGVYGYTAPLSDVQNIYTQLKNKGETQCCAGPSNAAVNIATSGNVAVDLVSDAGITLCAACSTVANYVGQIEANCQSGTAPNIMVGGTQEIVEAPALQVQI